MVVGPQIFLYPTLLYMAGSKYSVVARYLLSRYQSGRHSRLAQPREQESIEISVMRVLTWVGSVAS